MKTMLTDSQLTEIMRKNSDKFEVTYTGLLGQDFVTKDGIYFVKHVRIGGGFGNGVTRYKIFEKGNELMTCSIHEVYQFMVKKYKLE